MTLKFTNSKEAVQHLSDLTGKRIKIGEAFSSQALKEDQQQIAQEIERITSNLNNSELKTYLDEYVDSTYGGKSPDNIDKIKNLKREIFSNLTNLLDRLKQLKGTII